MHYSGFVKKTRRRLEKHFLLEFFTESIERPPPMLLLLAIPIVPLQVCLDVRAVLALKQWASIARLVLFPVGESRFFPCTKSCSQFYNNATPV